MKTIKHILYIILLFAGIPAMAQQTPAPAQSEAILITGATAHIGDGTVLNNSAIGFSNGKITFVGEAAAANRSDFSKVIDASGKHVYPGFIAPNTTLGLVEIDAVKATEDVREIGGVIPHVRSLIAYNAESKVVESMRPNGVLMAQIVPRGGGISGSSSVVQLDAWNWEDAAVKADEGIHINWPNSFTRGRWWMGEDPGIKPNKEYNKHIDDAKSFMKEAQAYLKAPTTPKNLIFEATKGLFNGTQQLYIHANGEKEIIDAVNFAKAAGIKKPVIINGDEAHKVADMLAANNIPVILHRPHRLPDNDDDDVTQPFQLAKLLTDKGVMVSIGMEGQMERMNTRNLPFYAGTCAAYGLDREKAVQLITGNAAKILGIADRAGTLEAGKDATLFISEGDALDMRTNILSHAFIQGRELSLETHQTKLWKRYSEKYGQKSGQ